MGRSRIYIPTYDDLLLRVSVSLILCTTRFSLNIFDDTKVGFEANFNSLFLLVTNVTSILSRVFSIVLPFISLKKSFSTEFLASALFYRNLYTVLAAEETD